MPIQPDDDRAAKAPLSTYRLQFNRDFTFEDARALVPYLARLGVSDLYASPYLEARPGSAHGYDIINHGALNPEIGTEERHAALTEALRAEGMGHLLDIVPNHMGVGTGENHRWQDVLENGPSSGSAPFFDIDWNPLQPELAGKVLLPFLGDQFGVVLERGELRLAYEEGHFLIRYHDRRFPVAPKSAWRVLRGALEHLSGSADEDEPDRTELESIVTALEHLPPRHRTDAASVAERRRENAVTRRRVSTLYDGSPRVREALDAAVETINGVVGEPHTFDALEALLDEQAYRLAFWRVAAEEINYRRFFDINDLAGVRVEVDQVFEETHALILRLVQQGRVTGLRIDHPDGLYDPRDYLHRLQSETSRRAGGPFYISVEKILTDDEELPESWPVAGTVGYEFLNRLNGIFVATEHEEAMTAAYHRLTGRRESFEALVYSKKRLILRVSLASELNVLAHLLNRLSESHRRFRDFTLNSLRDGLLEVTACFPVYRTYIDAHSGRITERDRDYIREAVRLARRRNRATSASLFDFIERTLLLDWPEDIDEETRREHARFVMKFQQLTGPVMAKGVEDTSFYIYNRLVSLNEVGGEPDRFGVTPGSFHTWLARRLERWPLAMNSTSTHDTKRSEDVRARIDVLSEIPEEWEARAERWMELNARHKLWEGAVPDANDEYLLYQTLIGAWPLPETGPEEHASFVERIQAYMEKATREAKVHTSWINPNEEYDRGLCDFIAAILDRRRENPFLDDLTGFQRGIARFGMLNALSQTLVKLTAPGVPDVYRGQELWDFSLVDPDNRRPVDFDLRVRLADELIERHEADGAALARELYEGWEDGRIKLHTTLQALRLRRRHPELLREAEYVPLRAVGDHERHVFAFARRTATHVALVVVPRLPLTLCGGLDAPLPTADTWGDTQLPVPDGLGEGSWSNVLTRSRIARSSNATLHLGEVLGEFPVALLLREL